MGSAPDLKQALRILFKALPLRRRRQAVLALFLMLLGAGAEMLGISAILVFLTLLTNPKRLTATPVWHSLESLLHYNPDPVLVSTIAFIVVMVASGAIRLAYTWLTSSFSINAGLDFSAAAFKKVTSQPYEFYLATGTDEILSSVEKIHLTNSVILVGVQAIVASTVALLIIGFLLFLDFQVALTIGIVLVGSYVAISLLSKSTLSRNSKIVSAAIAERIKRIQQSIGGIRDILLDSSQSVFQADFERSGDLARRPQVINSFVQYAPRIVIEVVGMMAITLLALALSRRPGGLIGALPILGALAIGAQRLLPLLQQAYYGWSMFFGNRQSLLEVAGLLSLPAPQVHEVPKHVTPFRNAIEFDHVSFSYGGDHFVLTDVNFVVEKGERVGIVGPTGSGKSTLTDLLLGLLPPTRGGVLVDGKIIQGAELSLWQAQVAHVPQSIYLSDDTVARNIAFGVPTEQIDMDLVESAALSAGVHEFVVDLPERYQTRCGERGIRLSGGQRQRIGIARALYKKATVLVLDEATSALDNATEQAVMQSISGLSTDITIVMIAHRLSSLSECGRIFRVDRGRLAEISRSSVGIDRAAKGAGRA